MKRVNDSRYSVIIAAIDCIWGKEQYHGGVGPSFAGLKIC